MAVRLQRVDPHDTAALRRWWEVGAAATAERPGSPWSVWEHASQAFRVPDPERDTVLLAAVDGDEAVGAGLLVRYLQDNRHAAGVDVWVLPGRRRRGIGSLLLADLESLAVADGRTTLLCEGFVPPGGTGPAEEFARVHGFEVASREVIRELRIADYLGRREAAVAASSPPAGYRLATFDTVCPEDLVVSFGRLLGMLMTEIPLGDLDLQGSDWPPPRVREAEERNVAIGRHVLTALAVAPDGQVAGASDVRVNDADPTHGQVGITIVDPAHRGHRLGLALKVATHDLALASYPRLETVDTSNAEVNTHMNAVNDQLGYRVIETLLELQKRLPA